MRRIKQFQVVHRDMHALCEDGTLWCYHLFEPDAEWTQAREIPDDEMFSEVEPAPQAPAPWRPAGLSSLLWCVYTGQQRAVLPSGPASAALEAANGALLVEANSESEAFQVIKDGSLIRSPVKRQRILIAGQEYIYLTDRIPF
jgi:hypothetical protein